MTGKEVKEILIKNKVKLAGLAKNMGISPQHLNNILKSPSIKTSRLEEISKHSDINFFSLPDNDQISPLLNKNANMEEKYKQLLNEVHVLREENERYKRVIDTITTTTTTQNPNKQTG